jgi:triphosphoribosyl-dephospho-CoA synthetase
MQTISSRHSTVRWLADQLVAGLVLELDLTPKPGLVDRWDNGSHADLNYTLMKRSIALLGNYFVDFTAALEAGLSVDRLRQIGINAEARMLASFGTNTHRGAIFLGGVLLAGVYRADSLHADTVSGTIEAFVLELFADRLPAGTTGARVRAQYGVGGIVAEALDGLPCLFQVGMPALHQARKLNLERERALYLVMARLMQTVEDTTALRRCGPQGLTRLREDGSRLEDLLLSGKDPVPFLVRVNERYRAWRLTMGGVADLIGMCVAWALFSGLWKEPSGVLKREKI